MRRGSGGVRSLLWQLVIVVLVQLATGGAQAVDDDPNERLEGEVQLLWPIHFTSLPLSTPSRSSLEPPDFGRALAEIAWNGFKKYTSTILPRELKMDSHFGYEFRRSDHSRVNLAFLRWQKRVFADHLRIPVSELTSLGEEAPRLKGIDYTWPELYGSPEYARLQGRIEQLGRLYLKRTGHKDLPPRFRTFVWAEIYQEGDAQRPWARTDGAYMMGRYFAKARRLSLKFNFEDPRGINPPYGKTYSHTAFQGNIILFPTWLSHFITPNMHNATAVCFGFILYPPDGNTLDWEDDKTGNVDVKFPIGAG